MVWSYIVAESANRMTEVVLITERKSANISFWLQENVENSNNS